jgi:16S rRNA (guanine966-N2)-methyltransferase
MRIISGKYGGRIIQSPHNNITHPMSEKMRGALFNALGDVTGLSFFDPFAGTGACSLEAISRGASHATLIEANTDSFKTMLANAKELGVLEQVTAIRGNCAGWSNNNKSKQFDIVLSDPPYKAKDINIALAFKMAQHTNDGGVFILSTPPDQHDTVELRFSQQKNLAFIMYKKHGDGGLYFYRKV